VVFDYYHRLSAKRQSIYRQSDAITEIPLPNAAALQSLLPEVQTALKSEQQKSVEQLAQRIADGITQALTAPQLRVQVLAVRPSDDWGELHGLYLPEDDGQQAKIQLWMRTAKNQRVVAFKSFVRTLLHELCHHLDYEHFKLPETFHTEGFYSRESSLFKQLAPASETPTDSAGKSK
jgi:WLM domain